ncbi:MAG: hypothetical protein L0Y79_13045 [Chlorobi bacterium]|nr:hypothetical protein [Chlorobiota bacterium]MCI0715712.1 hypothetical protein [Chlorobiota bacterium]
MDRYLIESTHTDEVCIHILDLILAQGYLTHYDWGCKDGVHMGWAIVEADSKEEAILTVPSLIRNKARVIKLNKFTPEDVKCLHNS